MGFQITCKNQKCLHIWSISMLKIFWENNNIQYKMNYQELKIMIKILNYNFFKNKENKLQMLLLTN